MRLLLVTAYFPPDTGSAAHLFFELGQALVKRGHQVMVLTSLPGYYAQGSLERYTGKLWVRESIEGMDVLRVPTPWFLHRFLVGRMLWQVGAAMMFTVAAVCIRAPEAALVYSPPLPLALTGLILRRIRGVSSILNVQDLFPQSAIDLGVLRHRVLIRCFEALERYCYTGASHITVHSEGNRAHVRAKGVEPDRVSVLPNWVDTQFLRPGPRNNGFRSAHGLGDRFVISFAGVLGYSQGLDVVIDAADETRMLPFLWLIVGEGVQKSALEERARKLRLANVRFLPMQPRVIYPSLLHASDVCLTTLDAQVKTPVVPSKILSIMAAGRPVVAALHADSDAARLIAEAQCGFSVDPGDARALASTVKLLSENAALRETLGLNGRQYVEKHLSLEACTKSYEQLFAGLL